jgi:hypothetical protein
MQFAPLRQPPQHKNLQQQRYKLRLPQLRSSYPLRKWFALWRQQLPHKIPQKQVCNLQLLLRSSYLQHKRFAPLRLPYPHSYLPQLGCNLQHPQLRRSYL